METFYTPINIAGQIVDITNVLMASEGKQDYILVEPCAGTGAISQFLPANSISMDINPKPMYPNVAIYQQDYFQWMPDPNQKYWAIGHPPAGHKSSVAPHFLDASYNKGIWDTTFILPNKFTNRHFQNRMNSKGWALIFQQDVGVMDVQDYMTGEIMQTMGVFQYWKNMGAPVMRQLRKRAKSFVDFVGYRPSKTTPDTAYKFQQCHFFIKRYYTDYPLWSFNFMDVWHEGETIGIYIKRNQIEILNALTTMQWNSIATLTSKGSQRYISQEKIEDELVRLGFSDF